MPSGAGSTSRLLLLRLFGNLAWLHQHASAGIGAGGVGHRKGYHEAGAAALGITQLHPTSVGVRDRPDDGEPEAAAAARRRVAVTAGEALEHSLAHRLRHAGPAV